MIPAEITLGKKGCFQSIMKIIVKVNKRFPGRTLQSIQVLLQYMAKVCGHLDITSICNCSMCHSKNHGH